MPICSSLAKWANSPSLLKNWWFLLGHPNKNHSARCDAQLPKSKDIHWLGIWFNCNLEVFLFFLAPYLYSSSLWVKVYILCCLLPICSCKQHEIFSPMIGDVPCNFFIFFFSTCELSSFSSCFLWIFTLKLSIFVVPNWILEWFSMTFSPKAKYLNFVNLTESLLLMLLNGTTFLEELWRSWSIVGIITFS